jgi:hypothetical protein
MNYWIGLDPTSRTIHSDRLAVMSQLLAPLPPNCNRRILCCYFNATSQIQIARIVNIPDWYLERVVFPGQHLLFETLPTAQLEVHTGMIATATLSDRISCNLLRVNEGISKDLPERCLTVAKTRLGV